MRTPKYRGKQGAVHAPMKKLTRCFFIFAVYIGYPLIYRVGYYPGDCCVGQEHVRLLLEADGISIYLRYT
jgi:hypothetical protein